MGLISGQVADLTLRTGQEQGQCGLQGYGVEGQSLLLLCQPPGQGQLWEETPGVPSVLGAQGQCVPAHATVITGR